MRNPLPGELTTVTPSGTGSLPTVGYGYDPSGRLSTVTREGASTPTSTDALYDGAGQLTSLTHSTASAVLDRYDITRDTRGNPTKVTTTAAGATKTALYGYDTVSRLTSECYPKTGASCTSTSPKTSYTYDKVGNRKTQSARTVVGTTATTVATAYAYDAANELLSETVAGAATVTNTWTPNGALATSETPTGTTTFTTDLTDELISAALEDGSTVSYTIDVKGNRTSRTVAGVTDATWSWDDLSGLPVRTGLGGVDYWLFFAYFSENATDPSKIGIYAIGIAPWTASGDSAAEQALSAWADSFDVDASVPPGIFIPQ